ncbi:MAG TPA: hypothetical protein K8V52_12260, partial [Enterococcus faecalis]|nr:hypothetical protein [Enterococcus faecalis]
MADNSISNLKDQLKKAEKKQQRLEQIYAKQKITNARLSREQERLKFKRIIEKGKIVEQLQGKKAVQMSGEDTLNELTKLKKDQDLLLELITYCKHLKFKTGRSI